MGLKEFLYSLVGLEKRQKSLVENMDAGGSVSKDFFYDVMDTQSSVFLFFTKDVGWIGANSRFFETFNYSSIEDFRDSNSSFRDFIEFEDDEVIEDGLENDDLKNDGENNFLEEKSQDEPELEKIVSKILKDVKHKNKKINKNKLRETIKKQLINRKLNKIINNDKNR